MALSEPFSIGPEQGEVHRNGGLSIVTGNRAVTQLQLNVASWPNRRHLARSLTAMDPRNAAGPALNVLRHPDRPCGVFEALALKKEVNSPSSETGGFLLFK
jgi:hypothetical protein